MFPFKSSIVVDKSSKTPIYQQISQQLIVLIREGKLSFGQKILSSRALSEALGVHRKTITQVFDELTAQGWLETKQGNGTFVAENLPEIQPQFLEENKRRIKTQKAGFEFDKKGFLVREVIKATDGLHIDDGFPDPRLAPLADLARAYRSNLIHGNSYQKIGYSDTKGSLWLRKELAKYLNESRGLNISERNLLIVRGTIMGLYLTSLAFIKPGDKVAIGESSWQSASIGFMQAGAELLRVYIDENGFDVDHLETLCKENQIRMIYITSHHNYPTTVTMKADRRVKLLQLAQKYKFIIFEDDYDYDFHYQSRPLMPLASADQEGMVLYSGSFTKSISPAFRVGYLVATEDVIEHLAHYRRIIDRQGDNMLENTVAQLLHEGIIQKHLRKGLKEYKIRRDFFCEELKNVFGNLVDFQIPEGGMSVWVKFADEIDMTKTAETALKNGLYLSNGVHHNVEGKIKNYTRLGFASSNLEELREAIGILKSSLIYRTI
jgi:GntR family transcriptional regulator / MocR family aminotransferase